MNGCSIINVFTQNGLTNSNSTPAEDVGKVKVDALATADYLGATGSTGALRVDSSLSKTDGGDFITLSVTNPLPVGTTNLSILSYDTTSSEWLERTQYSAGPTSFRFRQSDQITDAFNVLTLASGYQSFGIGTHHTSYASQSYARGLVVGYSRLSSGGFQRPQVSVVGDGIGGLVEIRTHHLSVVGKIALEVGQAGGGTATAIISANNDPYIQIQNNSSGGDTKIYTSATAGVIFRLPDSSGLANDILGNTGSGATTWVSPNVANGYVQLDGTAKIPSSLLPAIAFTEVYVVATIVERDALIVNEGDVCVVTDVNTSYIYDGSAWQELLTPTGAVSSVNGQTGVVVLTTTNIAEGTNLYYTTARFNTDFGTKTTDDLTEGATNLYFTTANFDTELATKTTDDLTEGATNLYNKNYITQELVAGENITAGDLCRLDTSTGQMMKADASGYPNLSGMLAIALDTLVGSQTGTFLIQGIYDIPILTASNGNILYVSTSSGAITTTIPATSGNQIRIIGYCINSTNKTIFFNPDNTILEVA